MEKIRLRAAGQMDAEELFEWRNEEETRKTRFLPNRYNGKTI